MTVYTRARTSALRMLTGLGEVGHIRRTSVSGGGPSDTSGGTVTETDHACRVALLPIDQRDVDGTLVKAGDWRAYVAASGLSITPTTTDKLVCSEGVLSIVDAGKFAPAGTVTHYEMTVRRA